MEFNDFLPPAGRAMVEKAIEQAEKRTSGEIVVHITRHCKGNPMKAAVKLFNKLGLYRTRRRNAVLVTVAFESRRFAIIGDKGIDDVVPPDFWNIEKETLAAHLAEQRPAEGLCKVVEEIGDRLAAYFPPDAVDNNEISNEVTYSEN